MIHLKINLRFTFLLFLGALLSVPLSAQDKIDLRLSGGIMAGYAPLVTHGNSEYSGVVVGVYGELEYGKVIGRLQYTKPLSGTFGENNLEDAVAYHGSLGYRLDISEKIFMGLLVSGGAMVIHYSTGFDSFTDVSPQVGVNIAPTYQVTPSLAIQAGLRYYKGFKAGDRGRASDLADISIALRYSLFQ
jgi:hypothetical protein